MTGRGQRLFGHLPDNSMIWMLVVRAADAIAIGVAIGCMILSLGFARSASALTRQPASGVDRDEVVVSGVSPSSSGIQAGFPSSSLTSDDVSDLASAGTVPDAQSVAATTGTRGDVHALDRSWHTDIIGSTGSFAESAGYQVVRGRALTGADIDGSAPTLLVGQTLVNALFNGQDPIGRSVVISGRSFKIVGAFAARGYAASYDRDDLVVMPITALWQMNPSGGRSIDQILMRAASPAAARQAAREARTALLTRHSIVNPAMADFTVVTQLDLAQTGIRSASDLKRVFELGAVIAFLLGIFQLARISYLQARGSQTEEDYLSILARAGIVGMTAAAEGIVLAYAGEPLVHHLASHAPPPRIGEYGVLAACGCGILAALISTAPLSFPAIHSVGRNPTWARKRADVERNPSTGVASGPDREVFQA